MIGAEGVLDGTVMTDLVKEPAIGIQSENLVELFGGEIAIARAGHIHDGAATIVDAG